MAENYLVHHGVKGMKWGVRRKEPAGSSYIPSQQRNPFEKRATDNNNIPRQQHNPFEKTLDGKPGKFKKVSASKVEKNKETYGLTKEKTSQVPDNKKQAEKLGAAAQLTKIGVDAVGTAGKMYDGYLKSTKAKSALDEARQMSDSELKARVQRLNLEQQYANMSPQTVSKGKQAVSNILSAVNVVGGLAVTGLTIASLVKKIKS